MDILKNLFGKPAEEVKAKETQNDIKETQNDIKETQNDRKSDTKSDRKSDTKSNRKSNRKSGNKNGGSQPKGTSERKISTELIRHRKSDEIKSEEKQVETQTGNRQKQTDRKSARNTRGSRKSRYLTGQANKSAKTSKSGKSVQSRQSVEEKFQKQFLKTSLCIKAMEGKCRRGQACQFAHSQEDIRQRPNLDKTKLCVKKSCTDPGCKFAHSRGELVATPNFSKTKLCHFGDKCLNGDRCRYAHDEDEIRARDSSGRKSAKKSIPLTDIHRRLGATSAQQSQYSNPYGGAMVPQALGRPFPGQQAGGNTADYAQRLIWDAYMLDTLYMANSLMYY